MEIIKAIGYHYDDVSRHWPLWNSVCINRLYHIHSGKGYYCHNGKKGEFEVGKLYYIPYSSDCDLRTDPNDPIIQTYIDFDFLPPAATKDILCADISDDPLLLSAVHTFDEGALFLKNNRHWIDYYEKNEPFRLLCNGAVSYILSYILKVNSVPFIDDKTIGIALDIMHTRMNEPITVEMLADKCKMNRDTFIRKFTKIMGVTPYAYLKNLRLRTAKMLKSDGLTLSKIASLTGYSDSSSLLHALNNSKD